MSNYNPQHHHRRSIRLKGYDYTRPGAYFITIVTHDRSHWFGQVVDGKMRLNDFGHAAEQCWRAIPEHFPHVRLDEFVIMPNHVHGILWIVDTPPTTSSPITTTTPPTTSPVGAKKFFAPTGHTTIPDHTPVPVPIPIPGHDHAPAPIPGHGHSPIPDHGPRRHT